MAKCALMLLGMALPRVLEAKKDWNLAISFESSDVSCITDSRGTAHLSNIIAAAQASLSLMDNAFPMDSLSISDVKSQDCVTTTTAAPTTTAATNATTTAPTPSTASPTPAPTPSTNSTTAAPTPSTASPTPAPTPSTNATTAAPTPSTASPTPAPTPSTNATTAAPTPATTTTTAFVCSAGGAVGCVGGIVHLVGVDDAQTKATLEASVVLLMGMKAAISTAFSVTINDFSIVANEAPAPTPAPSPAADADAAETARFGYSILASAALFVGTVRM